MKRKLLTGITCVFFFGWLLSGWLYLTGQAPSGLWDTGRVSAVTPG